MSDNSLNKVAKLLIYANPARDEGLRYAERVAEVAASLGVATSTLQSDGDRSELTAMLGSVDMVAVLGGDGTMLSAAVPAAEAGVPLLGINLGKLGFMTAFEASSIGTHLAEVLSGGYIVDERALLEVRVLRGKSEVFRASALNDAVIGPREIGRTVTVGLYSGGTPISTLRGDGVIAATPTGSTAYSLSAGGPIVDPRSDCMVLTPICAHTPYARPIVLPLSAEAEIRCPERAALTVDGQAGVLLEGDDRVLVGKNLHSARLVRLKNYSFYGIIGSKLWQTPPTEV